MQYKLQYDPLFDYPDNTDEKVEAYRRMSRYGTWHGAHWWEPGPSQDAEKRIPRENFIIIETKE